PADSAWTLTGTLYVQVSPADGHFVPKESRTGMIVYGLNSAEEGCIKITNTENCQNVNGIYQYNQEMSSFGEWENRWVWDNDENERRLFLINYPSSPSDFLVQLYDFTGNEFFYTGSDTIDISTGIVTGTAQLNGDCNYCCPGGSELTASVEFNVDCEAEEPAPKTYEVSLKLDPEYISKTKEERYFTPKPTEITPFDDVVCELETDDDSDFGDLVGRLLIKGLDVWKTVKTEVEVSSDVLKFSRIEERGGKSYYIYSWKISGWPNGWTTRDLHIAWIGEYPVTCSINVGEEVKESNSVKTSSCVHLWGPDGSVYDDSGDPGGMPGEMTYLPADFRIVYMYNGYSWLDDNSGWHGVPSVDATGDNPEWRTSSQFKKFVALGIGNHLDGFNNVDPFKTYEEKFAHYVDLKNVYIGVTMGGNSGSWSLFPSSCLSPSKEVIYSDQFNFDAGGMTQRNSPIIYMSLKSIEKTSPVFAIMSPFVILLHEMGHSFSSLEDEYIYPEGTGPEGHGTRNCRLEGEYLFPEGKKQGGIDYLFYPFGDSSEGCMSSSPYRPSQNSLMRGTASAALSIYKFNVVSCGYLVQKISNQQKSLKESMNECCSLQTIFDGGSETTCKISF
ncbi:MAG: hypothetical protein KKB21_05220, partial [Nanoarchaeota archaeon]|nr:hypothetical protein [Nanoarchaeota archaeon]